MIDGKFNNRDIGLIVFEFIDYYGIIGSKMIRNIIFFMSGYNWRYIVYILNYYFLEV